MEGRFQIYFHIIFTPITTVTGLEVAGRTVTVQSFKDVLVILKRFEENDRFLEL